MSRLQFTRDDGIVVVRVEKGCRSMAAAVRALREKLGDEAMGGLQAFVDDAGRQWKDDVLGVAAERFDRRLSEEVGALRLDMVKEFAGVRAEMGDVRVELRTGMATMSAELRTEMASMSSGLRVEMTPINGALLAEMASMNGAMRTEMATTRFDIVKWAFVFWIGQFAAVSAMMAFLLRTFRTP